MHMPGTLNSGMQRPWKLFLTDEWEALGLYSCMWGCNFNQTQNSSSQRTGDFQEKYWSIEFWLQGSMHISKYACILVSYHNNWKDTPVFVTVHVGQ